MPFLLNVPPEEYWRKWYAFDEAARFLDLTPADRHLAWVEATADEHWKEWPVPCEHFVHDPYYIGTEVLVRKVIGEFLQDFWSPDHGYELFVFIGGIGAGKSFSAALSLCYMLYQLGCLRRPQRYLNSHRDVSLSGDAEIVLMNASAAGAKQAGKIVYGEVFEKIQSSPFFQLNFEPYNYKGSELEFPNRIRLSPGTSQWQSALGWNLFGFVVDEAAFGIESERADYVKELFLALNQRRRSRFGRLGFGGLFTSPGSEHGYVEIIAGEGESWNQASTLVRRTTTWDAKDEVYQGQHVFLLDRDPDTVRILDSDLVYVAEGVLQREGTGEIVRYSNLNPEEVAVERDRAA